MVHGDNVFNYFVTGPEGTEIKEGRDQAFISVFSAIWPALIFLILFAFVSIVSRKSRFVYLLPSNDHNESKTTHLKRLPPFPGSGSVSR